MYILLIFGFFIFMIYLISDMIHVPRLGGGNFGFYKNLFKTSASISGLHCQESINPDF